MPVVVLMCMQPLGSKPVFLTVRAGNRRFWPLSALRPHAKAPHKMYFHRKTLRARLTAPGRPGRLWKYLPASSSEREGQQTGVCVKKVVKFAPNTTPRDL